MNDAEATNVGGWANLIHRVFTKAGITPDRTSLYVTNVVSQKSGDAVTELIASAGGDKALIGMMLSAPIQLVLKSVRAVSGRDIVLGYLPNKNPIHQAICLVIIPLVQDTVRGGLADTNRDYLGEAFALVEHESQRASLIDKLKNAAITYATSTGWARWVTSFVATDVLRLGHMQNPPLNNLDGFGLAACRTVNHNPEIQRALNKVWDDLARRMARNDRPKSEIRTSLENFGNAVRAEGARAKTDFIAPSMDTLTLLFGLSMRLGKESEVNIPRLPSLYTHLYCPFSDGIGLDAIIKGGLKKIGLPFLIISGTNSALKTILAPRTLPLCERGKAFAQTVGCMAGSVVIGLYGSTIGDSVSSVISFPFQQIGGFLWKGQSKSTKSSLSLIAEKFCLPGDIVSGLSAIGTIPAVLKNTREFFDSMQKIRREKRKLLTSLEPIARNRWRFEGLTTKGANLKTQQFQWCLGGADVREPTSVATLRALYDNWNDPTWNHNPIVRSHTYRQNASFWGMLGWTLAFSTFVYDISYPGKPTALTVAEWGAWGMICYGLLLRTYEQFVLVPRNIGEAWERTVVRP